MQNSTEDHDLLSLIEDLPMSAKTETLSAKTEKFSAKTETFSAKTRHS
jgi:hypothetical protein